MKIKETLNLYLMCSFSAEPQLHIAQQFTNEIFRFCWQICLFRELQVGSPINNLHKVKKVFDKGTFEKKKRSMAA